MIMRKRWGLYIVALLLISCFSSHAHAAYAFNFDERPIAFEPGKSLGYFLWQDKEGLHLRATSSGLIHTFSGTVRTDGRFEDVLRKDMSNNEDNFNVSNSQNKITFHFTAAEEEPGIDFMLSYGSYVKFSLLLDGKPIDAEIIFIGKDGWHPASNEFTLRHDEDYTKYMDGGIVYVIGRGLGRSGGHGPRPHR
jgi:hypothetical protein